MRGRRDEIDRLLRDGASIRNAPSEVVALAEMLAGLGLIRATQRQYVACANPADFDFPPRNRHCRGRVYLEPALDEAGHDYMCPECERPMFPIRNRKQRYRELQIGVQESGVLAYLRSRMPGASEVERGMFELEHAGVPAAMRVVEVSKQVRLTNMATLHLSIHSSAECADADERERLTLADVLAEVTTLPEAIARAVVCWSERLARSPRADCDPPVGPCYVNGTIAANGVRHRCQGLTIPQIEFLRIALPNAETPVDALWGGAIWTERYNGTQKHRDRVAQLVSRINVQLKQCDPPLGIRFSLRTNQDTIARMDSTPSPADSQHSSG